MGGNTLDKRHADFNDELGYIAPPNRKLPPVPGSNYNTCDRIKRGKRRLSTNNLRQRNVLDVFFFFVCIVFRFFPMLYNFWVRSTPCLLFCHLTVLFLFSSRFNRSGFPGPYNGHGTWNPRARHMYEELNGSNPRCRGHLPPCPGSDETMYTRCRGKKDDARTIN